VKLLHNSDTLLTLSNLEFVSGYEFNNSNQVKNLLFEYCDEVVEDKMGNIIGIRKSSLKHKNVLKIMLASHLDEIGLMVKEINKDGFLKFVSIGGIDPRILLAQEVIVHGREKIYGVIGAKPPHLLKSEELSKAIKIEDLYIDVGFKKDLVEKKVSVGDIISFNVKSEKLLNNNISGKSLDNRAGIIAIIECLKELKNVNVNCDIYSVATVQEEVGLRGAETSVYNIEPDMGIAIDVCHGQTPDSSNDETFELNKGPVITLGPNIHSKLFNRIKDVASDYFIEVQTEIEPGSTGTDAWAIQVSKCGVPTLLLSIPLRYMHTTVETLNYNDIVKLGKILAFFIRSLDMNLEEFLCY
jgi:endoglucanase